jgi:hypothetical protein
MLLAAMLGLQKLEGFYPRLVALSSDQWTWASKPS